MASSVYRLILLVFFSLPVYGDSHSTFPFTYESVVGDWHSNWTSVKGEEQSLQIRMDGTTRFTREFDNGTLIDVFSSKEDTQVLDDIILVTYYDGDFGIRYKLVLSGWHIQEGKTEASAMYGMLFLYQEGRQFNGFPVSFRPAI